MLEKHFLDDQAQMHTPLPSDAPLVGLLLAAGFSRRFGVQNKLLQPLPNGECMAVVAARSLITALPHSVAVIRANVPELSAALKALGLIVVECGEQEQVMADSLKLGLNTVLTAFPQCAGVVIALADMPFIQPQTIQHVANALAQHPLVQPVMAGKPGHPVGFSRALIPELLRMEGDQGAREVVRAHQAQSIHIACEDPGIFRDIDTPADLK